MKFSRTFDTGSCFLRKSGRGVAWTNHPFSAGVENGARLAPVSAWHVVGEPVRFIAELQKPKQKALLFTMDFESHVQLHWPIITIYLCIMRMGWFIRNLRNVRPIKPVDKLRAVLNFMDLFTWSAWSNTTSYEGLQFYILESSTEKCWNNVTGKHMPNAKSCFIC